MDEGLPVGVGATAAHPWMNVPRARVANARPACFPEEPEVEIWVMTPPGSWRAPAANGEP